MSRNKRYLPFLLLICLVACNTLTGCNNKPEVVEEKVTEEDNVTVEDVVPKAVSAKDIRQALNIKEDYRDCFVHGEKPAKYQKYIVMHDTEGLDNPSNTINWWANNGNKVAAHFIVDRDGTIYQCVDMDKIAHHIGFGDTGHNKEFDVEEDGRDDKVGTKSIGSWASDYGMNAYSIGIEMVHISNGMEYPEEQLKSVDKLIAYINTYYGFDSKIIDHKTWRSGNSDCSAEFQGYLKNLQDGKNHDGSSRDELIESFRN